MSDYNIGYYTGLYAEATCNIIYIWQAATMPVRLLEFADF
jgi:hypothetical protein